MTRRNANAVLAPKPLKYEHTAEQMLFIHAIYFIHEQNEVKCDEFSDNFFEYLRENHLLFSGDEDAHPSRGTRTGKARIHQQIRNLISSHKSLVPSEFFEIVNDCYRLKKDVLPSDTHARPTPQRNSSKTPGENVILYGAPGTGKSTYIEDTFGDNIIRTIFFPEYLNADFVGTYQPVSSDGGEKFTYEFVPGPLIKAICKAKTNTHDQICLVIEEINRGDAASIFGEYIQLLDRQEDGASRFSISCSTHLSRYLESQWNDSVEQIKLPDNLSIYATMNTWDEGSRTIDAAFRRRWKFKYMPICFDQCSLFEEKVFYNNNNSLRWGILAQAINACLKNTKAEDKLIGPYFLAKCEHGSREVFCDKVLHYLFETLLRFDEEREVIFVRGYSTFCALRNDYLNGVKIFSDNLSTKIEEIETSYEKKK